MIEVLECALPASFQDLGRPGYRHLGVPLSGALDPEWLAIANALVTGLLGRRELAKITAARPAAQARARTNPWRRKWCADAPQGCRTAATST